MDKILGFTFLFVMIFVTILGSVEIGKARGIGRIFDPIKKSGPYQERKKRMGSSGGHKANEPTDK